MARRAAVRHPTQLSLFDEPVPTALIPVPRVPKIPREAALKSELKPTPVTTTERD